MPTVTANFETDLGNFFAEVSGTATVAVSADVAHGGTKSAKCTCPSGEFTACLQYRFGNAGSPWLSTAWNKNPALGVGGFWVQWWQYMVAADINHIADQGFSRKLNFNLFRKNIDIGGSVGAYLASGIGLVMGTNDEWRNVSDSGNPDPPTLFSYSKGSNGKTTVTVPAAQWLKVVYNMERAGGVGRSRCWLNDTLVTDTGWWSGLGTDTTTDEQSIRIGGGIVNGHTQSIVVYVDDVTITDTPIYPDGSAAGKRFKYRRRR